MKFPSFNQENTPACIHCGTSPVIHWVTYISQSLSVFATPSVRVRVLLGGKTMRLLERLLMRSVHTLFEFFGLMTYGNDVSKALSERSRVVWDEAERRGIVVEQAYLQGRPTELYRVQRGKKWEYFISIPISEGHQTDSALWIDDKGELKKALTSHSVPVPRGGQVWTKRGAHELFAMLEKPVIVKPALGSRGRHTTTFIHTKEELNRAVDIAQKLCQACIVEEHLTGNVYRVTCVGGKVVGVLSGEPPRITGDGVSIIQTLIEEKNSHRHERQQAVPVNESTLAFLKRQGYTYETVLTEGDTIDLSEKVGLSYGGSSEEILPLVHKDFIVQMENAARVLNAPLVGFDVISEDPTKDPRTVRWGIIEANGMPFINLHHHPLHGTPVNVAEKVWDLWLTA